MPAVRAQPGVHEHVHQRRSGDQDARLDHRQHGALRRQDPHLHRRRRRWHSRGSAAAHIRSLFHDQAGRRGYRSGLGDFLWHRDQAPRHDSGDQRARAGHDVPDRTAHPPVRLTGQGVDSMYRVLLVDDEPNILNALRRSLASIDAGRLDGEALKFDLFASPEAAIERCEEAEFDLIISDYRMPSMNGVEFLIRLMDTQPSVPRVIISGYADRDAIIAAVNEAQLTR